MFGQCVDRGKYCNKLSIKNLYDNNRNLTQYNLWNNTIQIFYTGIFKEMENSTID